MGKENERICERYCDKGRVIGGVKVLRIYAAKGQRTREILKI